MTMPPARLPRDTTDLDAASIDPAHPDTRTGAHVPDAVATITGHTDPSGAAVLTVAGELDYHTATELREALEETPFTPAGVVLDLTDLTYCDSTGLTVLVRAHHQATAAKAPLFLVGLNADLQRMFEIVGLDQLFPTRPTVQEALASCRDEATL